MMDALSVDRVLVQWGDRLFFPGNRIVKPDAPPHLHGGLRQHAALLRQRIQATVVRRAPQVFVKVRGGGRGMQAIASHFQYLSRDGELALEDDRGVHRSGKLALRDLLEQWRLGWALIGLTSPRQEANYLVLSTLDCDPEVLMKAARAFARSELQEHRYVMALHLDADHPHVHLTVRKESKSGQRLDPWVQSRAWRSVFAEKLRDLGVDVEATTQASRGENRRYDPIWRAKAREAGELPPEIRSKKPTAYEIRQRALAMQAWAHIMEALRDSDLASDRQLAESVGGFIRDCGFFKEMMKERQERPALEPARLGLERTDGLERTPTRSGPEISR